jgi:hypothetical protein
VKNVCVPANFAKVRLLSPQDRSGFRGGKRCRDEIDSRVFKGDGTNDFFLSGATRFGQQANVTFANLNELNVEVLFTYVLYMRFAKVTVVDPVGGHTADIGNFLSKRTVTIPNVFIGRLIARFPFATGVERVFHIYF